MYLEGSLSFVGALEEAGVSSEVGVSSVLGLSECSSGAVFSGLFGFHLGRVEARRSGSGLDAHGGGTADSFGGGLHLRTVPPGLVTALPPGLDTPLGDFGVQLRLAELGDPSHSSTLVLSAGFDHLFFSNFVLPVFVEDPTYSSGRS